MIRVIKRVGLTALLVLVVAGAVGCSVTPTLAPPAEEGAGQETASPDVSQEIEAMLPNVKQAQLVAGFPVEVPVPVGTVVSAKSQGPDAWDYEIVVEATPEALRDWYGGAYTARSWTVVDYGQLTQGEGYFVELRKNAAESRVDVVGSKGVSPSTARVVVGIGAPVLETF